MTATPEALLAPDKLTEKQRRAYTLFSDVNSPCYNNLTSAVMNSYNCKSRNSASVIASKLRYNLIRHKEKLERQGISTELANQLTPDAILGRIDAIAKNARRDSDKLKALELLGRFHELSYWRDNSSVEIKATAIAKSEDELTREFQNLVNSRRESKDSDDKTLDAEAVAG